MQLAPITLQHGERYGRLTVLAKVKSSNGWSYRCGCECGTSDNYFKAKKLMSGKVKACRKCASAL